MGHFGFLTLSVLKQEKRITLSPELCGEFIFQLDNVLRKRDKMQIVSEETTRSKVKS